MFLATTALSEFWDDREEILFLGSWCLRHAERSARYRVLPSPWTDRERFYRAVEYLDRAYERMLERLSAYLNRAHGTALSARYWRILIGPWLLHYLHALYDRYAHLEEAFRGEPGIATVLMDPACYRVPRSGRQFASLISEDPYNLQIISEILAATGRSFPTRPLAADRLSDAGPPERAALSPPLRRRLARFLQQISSPLLRKWCRVGIVHADWSRPILWKLALSTRGRAVPLCLDWPNEEDPVHPVLEERRTGLARLEAGDEFERVWAKTLPHNFPLAYLEGFCAAREQAVRCLKQAPPALLSGYGWYFHEAFQFLAAEGAQAGSILLAVQHGGGYGVHRFSPQEKHEIKIADRFFTWGWGNGSGEGTRPLPSPKLSSSPERRRPSHNGFAARGLVFVASNNPRYRYRFYSSPHGAELLEYFEWQHRFLRALPEPVRCELLFRSYPHDFGHDRRRQLSLEFPWLRWDGERSFHRRLGRSMLVIIDHLGTPILEALASNLPTIAYWHPHHWEIREEASPYFAELRRVGILLDSPEEAAARSMELHPDPWEWWSSQPVQKARDRFAQRYALREKGWEREWNRALNEELAHR